jgi:hypothetical protein
MITSGITNHVTHEWTRLLVDPATPVVLASMQTFNDSDTATVRLSLHTELTPPERLSPGTVRIEGLETEIPIEQRFAGVDEFVLDADPIRVFRPMVKIEEERSDDDEVEHEEETVGHIAFDPGTIENAEGDEIGVAGFLPIDDTDRDTWISLPVDSRSFPVDESVAFVQVLSFDGPHPVHPRIATSHPFTEMPGFHFRMEEWPTYDGRHRPELLAYVLLRRGVHRLDGVGSLHLDVGTTEPFDFLADEDSWETVELDPRVLMDTVVVTQCQTFNGHEPVVTRQRSLPPRAGDPTFEVRLQEAEGGGADPSSTGDHRDEEVVGYVAMGRTVFL